MGILLLKAIKSFLSSLDPDIIVQAPSRINLINPLDAVEGDFWMPSVAINGLDNPLSVFLYIKNIDGESRLKVYSVKELTGQYSFVIESDENLLKDMSKMRSRFDGNNKLIYASIYRICKMSSSLEELLLNTNIEIGYITTIPEKSGLGGSAAIIIAILYGLTQFFNLLNKFDNLNKNEFPLNKDTIAEIATKIEDEDLKITSGYGDRYVISRGGLCFCSYQGKLHHKNLSDEPLAIYDRIDEVYELNNFPIIVGFSGVTHESGDVHRKLRKIYLQNNPILLNNYKRLAEIAWKSRFAIMRRDWTELGGYFKENTEIMNIVMKEVGFEYGIGLANNILINIIEKHPDVYAAKLTGAGGGGSVFALVNPSKIENIMNFWRDTLNKLISNKDSFNSRFPSYPTEITERLKDVKFFQIEIDKKGVKKLFP